ncbi:SE-domain-containing protein [Schizophyllum commune H4-8]|uniref:SE-domain-containing protein n=1 Tax=Schizophyllum commune (strain H4-8 / FGSC 9210) TaxID=578458 RepID=UPI00215FAC35|nr:SE-domain-containing protein [Schizophyllum commune H4-8]KAI5887401.1 SE-domain-containing protein [Schizophyllum commune H4-8]
MADASYDLIIVGAGVVGSALAYGLSSSQPHLRICLLERSLAEPDRIVGELLQPGGVRALEELGMKDALDGIDSSPTYGYCVMDTKEGTQVQVPYQDGKIGACFHHGRFINALRAKVAQRNRGQLRAGGIDMLEATVSELITEDDAPDVVLGVRATRKTEDGGVEKVVYRAPLTVICDGCFSNFRNTVLGEERSLKPTVRSHFVGLVVRGLNLPYKQHGTVALVQGHGPILMYQIDTAGRGEDAPGTRMLVDVRNPFPDDLKDHIASQLVPQLPETLRGSILDALNDPGARLRRMPNSFLPPAPQHTFSPSHLTLPLYILYTILWPFISLFTLSSSIAQPAPATKDGKPAPSTARKRGVILVGDAYNMRHPLTGGGMTVGLHDAAILMRLLGDLAAPKHENLDILRTGCMRYFQRGGKCVSEPVGILSGLIPSPLLLMQHFFAVAFYAIHIMWTTPDAKTGKTRSALGNVVKGISVLRTACIVFLPLLWTEVRCWAPGAIDKSLRPLFLVALAATAAYIIPSTGLLRDLTAPVAAAKGA